MAKRLFIKTYGCQMNVYDSRRMADLLAPHGYEEADAPEGADLVILNTCHIREKAAEKVYSELGRLRAAKAARAAEGKEMVVCVAGCVAQAEGVEITRRAPVVDLVLGPQSYHRLPEALARRGGARVLLDFPPEEKFDALPGTVRADGPAAFLSIQEGCDKFCTFCVVPYTRGPEYSRPLPALMDEARAFVDQGVREITLLGQNVNAWRGTGPDGRRLRLADLLASLSEIEGLARLRYTTSHPRDMDDDLIAAHGALPKLMPQLHLPVQAGSDRILAAMNRQHTAADYLDIVARLRAARPGLALSSDFIVGFPGESEADFEETLRLVGAVGFAQSFSFKYSRRPGTPGAALPGQVAEEAKAERLARLQALLEAQADAFRAGQCGFVQEVLFDRPGRHPGQMIGRSPHFEPVFVEGPETLLGRIVPVEILDVSPHSLMGRLCAREEVAA
ncbi:MAG: tRNA (N6-isopentenyl adenosine(37)-C2)-methylthiotransferase MiaB [Alphaproteobacteria bacterium]|nr:tRNA (N6-isopentenyl adenosine(37)-C2)-methylthiotransferase MiaB [Alphaproteobacteria bacterium]